MKPVRPNILVLTTDQHRYDALSCRNHPHVKTPHLDSLVRDSADFQCAYTQSPVCAPARYSLATGDYVPTHGVRFNAVNPTQPVTTIAHRLKAVGYRCFQAGHMHWSEKTTDTGYEPLISRQDWLDSLPEKSRERFQLEHDHADVRIRMGGPCPCPEEQFFAPFVAQSTNRFIEEAVERETPFFAWASIFEPHPPFFPPAEVYRRLDPEAIVLPPESPSDAPPPPDWLQKRRQRWEHLTAVEIRQMMRGYYGLVEVADRAVGSILQKLEDLGVRENTWILWTSDHGEQLFDHGVFLKFCMLEESVHIPFCIQGPGIEPSTSQQLTSHIDLHPTLCAIAGIPIPSHLPGRSLLAEIQNPSLGREESEFVYAHIWSTQMIRSREEKLVVRDGEPTEFYQLKEDPGEFYNRLEDATCRERIQFMLRHLKTEFPEEFQN